MSLAALALLCAVICADATHLGRGGGWLSGGDHQAIDWLPLHYGIQYMLCKRPVVNKKSMERGRRRRMPANGDHPATRPTHRAERTTGGLLLPLPFAAPFELSALLGPSINISNCLVQVVILVTSRSGLRVNQLPDLVVEHRPCKP